MPVDFHPQYITDHNGRKVSIVLSIEEFEAILEDLEDLAIVAERKDEETTSHEDLLMELQQDGIV
ncbi:MAG: hypothetical protein FAF05_05880 [Epsilonproteobacteria bacterium]|nr:hypothetical protein [Campylobacterota bacterium]